MPSWRRSWAPPPSPLSCSSSEGLEYISSAGIRSILRARKAIEGRGGRVAIVNAQAPVLKVFEIVKALPADQVFASEAELDAYLARMQQRARESR